MVVLYPAISFELSNTKKIWVMISRFLFRYGGGPTISRKLIPQGFNGRELSVEVYLLCLRITNSIDSSQKVIYISKKVVYFLQLVSPDAFWLEILEAYAKFHGKKPASHVLLNNLRLSSLLLVSWWEVK